METTKTNTSKTVLINRTVNLPLQTVWKAWTEPEYFKKWWGPHAYTCTYCIIDLKVGGKYLANMKSRKDGTENFSTGTYKEIIPEKKLVMTDSFSDDKGNIIPAPEGMPGEWPEALIITVELLEEDDKTLLRLKQEPMPAEAYEECIQGWRECFEKLEKNLKSV